MQLHMVILGVELLYICFIGHLCPKPYKFSLANESIELRRELEEQLKSGYILNILSSVAYSNHAFPQF